jgi:protoheme IX farnesyltransferase
MLVSIGLILSWTLGLLFFLIGLAGLLDYVLVYSYFYKRRTWASVLYGSFSGGAPVLGGWVVVTQTLSIESLILAVIVILWIPGHIWSLALSYADDYRAADIPMLPVVAKLSVVTRSIAFTILLLAGLSIVPIITGFAGIWYVAISLPVTIIVIVGNSWLAISPSKRLSWTMFKISSPYLFILFFALIVDVLV